jgi:acyl carrier protein
VTRTEIAASIQTALDRLLEDKGMQKVAVAPDTALLEGGIPIDSLDLAQLVLELQEKTGRDPFASGFIEFRTVGELTNLFSE